MRPAQGSCISKRKLKNRSLEIYIDGASKGNPGKSGIGVVINEDGQVIKNIYKFIGEATNNIAEYVALIFALQEALMQRASRVEIKTDSQLLCNQINGKFKVKNANLKLFFQQAQHLISGFENFRIEHIPREMNKGADKLATKAIKEQAKTIASKGRGKSELQREA